MLKNQKESAVEKAQVLKMKNVALKSFDSFFDLFLQLIKDFQYVRMISTIQKKAVQIFWSKNYCSAIIRYSEGMF